MKYGKGVLKKRCFFDLSNERQDKLIKEMAEFFHIVKIYENGERVLQMGPDLKSIYHNEVIK